MEFIKTVKNEYVEFTHTLTSGVTDNFTRNSYSYYLIKYFVKGNISYLIDGEQYRPNPGSVILLKPDISYGVKIEDDTPYELITILFNPNILSIEKANILLDPFQKTESSTIVYYNNINKLGFDKILFDFEKYSDLPNSIQNIAMTVSLEKFLLELLLTNKSSKNQELWTSHDSTIKNILYYINTNITTHISLDMLSEKFFISKHHLNKKFKKYMGTTIGEYIIRKRVLMAYQLIAQGESANNAALASGFNDYSVFYRACKRIWGHSPVKGRNPE